MWYIFRTYTFRVEGNTFPLPFRGFFLVLGILLLSVGIVGAYQHYLTDLVTTGHFLLADLFLRALSC